MTPHLHVQLRLCDAVIEDRLVEVRGQTWFGECDGALVPFEGGIVGVRALSGALWVRGVELDPDVPLVCKWGDVELRLAAVVPEVLPRDWSAVPDPKLLVATAALVLVGAFIDTLGTGWEQADARQAAVERVVRGVEPASERYAVPPPVEHGAWPRSATYASHTE